MKLSTFKDILHSSHDLQIMFIDGTAIPAHFHITEVGLQTRKFIDCGGTMRETHVINLQLWTSHDTDHRLSPTKLLKIIDLSNKTIDLADHSIEVEYQGSTIEKYGLEHNGKTFVLQPIYTDCLAKDKCGIVATPQQKKKGILSRFSKNKSDTCCSGGNCC